LFGKHDVGSIIGGKIVTQLPDAAQKHLVRISSDTEIQQIRIASSARSAEITPCDARRRNNLRDLKIEKVRRV